jgi:hypothetical protein
VTWRKSTRPAWSRTNTPELRSQCITADPLPRDRHRLQALQQPQPLRVRPRGGAVAMIRAASRPGSTRGHSCCSTLVRSCAWQLAVQLGAQLHKRLHVVGPLVVAIEIHAAVDGGGDHVEHGAVSGVLNAIPFS